MKLLLALGLFFGGVSYEEAPQEQPENESVVEQVQDEDKLKEEIDKLLDNSEVKEKISQAVEEKLKEVIGTYTDEKTTESIVGWIVNIFTLIAIFGLIVAQIKKKGTITLEDAKSIVSKEIKDDSVKDELNKFIEKNNEKLDVIVKALVLAQDKSAESKLALLDLFKTKESKIVAEKIVKEEQAKEEATEIVKEDYKDIF